MLAIYLSAPMLHPSCSLVAYMNTFVASFLCGGAACRANWSSLKPLNRAQISVLDQHEFTHAPTKAEITYLATQYNIRTRVFLLLLWAILAQVVTLRAR
jgi:hypothetical protein